MHNILFGQINVPRLQQRSENRARREGGGRKTVEKLAFALARSVKIVSDFANRGGRRSLTVLIARKRRPRKIKYSFSRGKGDESLIGSSIKIPATAVKFTREKEITYRIR